MIVLTWFSLAVSAFWIDESAFNVSLSQLMQPQSNDYLFGTDELGRSLFQRLLLGAQTSILVALGVVVFSAIIGITIGTISGFLGGWLDRVVLKIIDIFLAFPGLLLAIGLAAILGPGIENVVFALVVVGWVGYARLARAQVLSLKHREHIQAARALGTSTPTILWRHLLPLMMAPLGVEATFGIAGAIISEAGLSFLGLGVQAPDASWGAMIKEGSRYLLVAPHMVLFPGVALMAVVLAINLLGDAWRDHLDIKTRNT